MLGKVFFLNLFACLSNRDVIFMKMLDILFHICYWRMLKAFIHCKNIDNESKLIKKYRAFLCIVSILQKFSKLNLSSNLWANIIFQKMTKVRVVLVTVFKHIYRDFSLLNLSINSYFTICLNKMFYQDRLFMQTKNSK